MREIKFRAWGPNSKYMWPWEEMGWQMTLGGVFGPDTGEKIVMQFTGLLDKNGKEIYEGDILTDDCENILEVKFGELPLDKSGDCVCTYQSFYCKDYGKLGVAPWHECQNIGDWMEVIGNIHENKDLLEVKP